jgi:hypothetical protein
MPRNSTVDPRLAQAKRAFAELFAAHLKRGQRGDGEPERNWRPWTDGDFAARVGDDTSPSSVRNWRNTEHPITPAKRYIAPLREALFGDRDEFKRHSREFYDAWERAAGLTPLDEADEPAAPPGSEIMRPDRVLGGTRR